VRTQMWIVRASHRSNLVSIWALWILGTAALAVVAAQLSSSGWFTGMVIGASLSHAVETSWRGEVCDYVCLRFWPAFNLSDVALAVGAVGIGVGVWI
jgi:signal peptidase II